MAAAMGEVGLTVAAQYYLGHLYHGLGDYRQAIVCMQQNVASLHGTLRWERFGLHGLLSVHARSQLVCYLAECGAFAKGQRLAEEAVQIAEMAQHPYSRVMAYWGMGVRHLCQGEITRAIVVFEHALQLVQEADLRLLGPKVTAALGAAYALTGRTAAALRLLRQAMTQGVAMRYLWDHALRTVWLGEAYLRAGYADEASTQAQRALACARMYQQRGYAGYALRLLGEIHAHRRPPQAAQAETAYREALALADALGMRPLQAHCHRGLGTLYATTGQREQARAELATAIDLYRVMDMTFWLPQTEAALVRAG
jgi:tetratricopeptide (TPR) repeat protein